MSDMSGMAKSIHEAALEACRSLLVPVVRFLIRNGVNYREFSRIATSTFVHVAREEYGKRGRPSTTRRIAELTGLSRKDVRLALELDGPQVGMSVASTRILELWHELSEYLDESGKPAELALHGPGS